MSFWLFGVPMEALPDEPVVTVEVHAHCWIDHAHVLTLRVNKKMKDEDRVWTCEQCQVRERIVPCRKRKCRELVPA